MTAGSIRALVWSERTEPVAIYPDGINGAVAAGLRAAGIDAGIAQLEDDEQGLGEEALARTDVLLWWGHKRHKNVNDESVARVLRHVTERGMGLIPLHSAHKSRPFMALLGTTCKLGGYREDGLAEHIYVVETDHPIARGGPLQFIIPAEEMYRERFDVPPPDELIFLSSFAQGEVFRSGCCWTRGKGRIFYFQPGHETYAVYCQAEVQQILVNAVTWAVHGE